MSNETPKQTPAQLEYSKAVKADPHAFHKERTHKTSMTELEAAQHQAFLNGHPFAKQGDDHE
jgi:hypothetical protein